MGDYLARMRREFDKEFSLPFKQDKFNYDCFDSDESSRRRSIILRDKQFQMKKGKLIQASFGLFPGFVNLGNGGETGLDILSEDRKVVAEIKLRTNTDNSSSRKANIAKLVKFAKEHPGYTCVYGCVNEDTEKGTLEGHSTVKVFDGVEILFLSGMKLFEYIFGSYAKVLIGIMKREFKAREKSFFKDSL